jgi:hypothetical protein
MGNAEMIARIRRALVACILAGCFGFAAAAVLSILLRGFK